MMMMTMVMMILTVVMMMTMTAISFSMVVIVKSCLNNDALSMIFHVLIPFLILLQNAAFLMEFLEDSASLTKSQRLRYHLNDKNASNLGQTELDSDDDSDNSCETCQTCELERTPSNKRSHSEASSELKCTNMPFDNPTKSNKMFASLGLSNEDLLNTLTEEIVGSLLLRHQQQMPCNVHAITAIVSTSSSDEENDDDSFSGVATNGQVITREQRRIATAIYPTGSLINHTCDPDIIVR